MPSAIGLRGYLITVHKTGDRAVLPFSARELTVAPGRFVQSFISRHLSPTRNNEMERSWYFEQLGEEGSGNSCGYIHYGTFGYESNLKDSKTKTTQYRRQVDDVEEIPLFYEFWLPDLANYGFAMFQS